MNQKIPHKTKVAKHKGDPHGASNNAFPEKLTASSIELDLDIEVQKEVSGIEMGILENGIPYLTQRGLGTLCGTAHSVIYDITKEWEEHYDDAVIVKGRIAFIRERLFSNGYREKTLYLKTKKDGIVNYAYPDVVCMMVLEYFAFEATQNDRTIAINNYRDLASYGLRRFIYDALKFTPHDKWTYHNERVSLLKDSVPDGYFSIFKEVSGLILDLITADLPVNEKTVPDISVGTAWSMHWKDNNMADQYGDRVNYDHYYPVGYKQAESNPQQAKAYPDKALPEFRRWFKQEYLLTKFPAYILSKAKILPGGAAEAQKIAQLYKPKILKD